MSSYDGSDSPATDFSLQEAPAEGLGPDFGTLKKSFEDCVSNLQPYVDQCRDNYETRYAIWNGQSSDGRKHSREGSKVDPTPWEGASDLRVFLTDEAINAKVAMLCMAFRRANIVAVPVEGNDLKRAKTVSGFMRWLVQTQIPEIDREVELLSNYIYEKGVGITGQFWEMVKEKTLTSITLDQLQQQFPTMDVLMIIQNPETSASMAAIFEEVYGCSGRKAKKMISELLLYQKTTVPVVGRERSYPVVRAFNLDENLFIPHFSTDLETAPAIYRVQYFTAEQLRAFVLSEDWDEDWVEAAITTCRGRMLTIIPSEYTKTGSRAFSFLQSEFSTLIGVVYAYQRLSDEDGVPGVYLTIFHPDLPPDITHEGYAKYGLLGYAHGKYPFVLHRREFLSRRLHDSRGIPEPGKPIQDQIKVHKDSQVDAASLAILPPMGYPVGRPPGRWGAGARVPERRPGEYHFMDRPMPDSITENSEALLRDDFNQYNSFTSKGGDAQFALIKNQFEADKFMSNWAKAFSQIWSLYQQFGSEQVYFRVVGLRQLEPIEFNKGDQGEEFDFILSFRVDSMDTDASFARLEQIAKIVATANRDGIVDYSEWLQVMIEAVDPTIAERILIPKEVGQEKAVTEIQDTLAKVYAGQDHDIKDGTPPEVGMSTIQNYIQSDPVVQARMQNKADPFGQRIEKLMKQLQFQVTQQNNAKIGRMGA